MLGSSEETVAKPSVVGCKRAVTGIVGCVKLTEERDGAVQKFES
jgi:hypothetical protein